MENVIFLEQCRCKCHKNKLAEKYMHEENNICCLPCIYCPAQNIPVRVYQAHKKECRKLYDRRHIDTFEPEKCMADYTDQ